MIIGITMDSTYHEESHEYSMDFDWGVFTERLFQSKPAEPFTYRLEFLDEIDRRQLIQLLSQMVMTGAKQLYDKDLGQVTEAELQVLKHYCRSLGFDFECEVTTSLQYIHELKKTMPVNQLSMDFKPCSQLHNVNNKPEKIIP